MGQKTYNKLVRDKIPEIIESSGRKCVTRVLDSGVSRNIEHEVAGGSDRVPGIRAGRRTDRFSGSDIRIVEANGMHLDEFEELRLKKQRDRGGFHNRIVLECVSEAGRTTAGDLSGHMERTGLTYFIGIDLAFSAKNDSGVVVLAGDGNLDNLTRSRLWKSDENITEFIIAYLYPGNLWLLWMLHLSYSTRQV